MLVIENLVKNYGQKQVIKSFNIIAKKGEIIALLGPNGAGKTTSFYMISGIIKPNAGKIIFNNIDITHLPIWIRAKMGIGYLPQEASIFRDLSVEDNILCILEIYYKNKQIKQEKLEELLNDFHIQHIRKNYGKILSGGERRRVEVARMLAANPKCVLLDEPFAGVDPIAVNDIKRLIEKLKNKGICVIITDHNVREALKIANRGYILYDGEILCQGSPEEIFQNKKVREVYLGNNFNY